MYREVFLYFLRLGLVGFGGPLALIASMQRDLIEDRKWLDRKKFQNAFTLIKSMPGPIAFSTAVYLGKLRAGFVGAFLAGFGLIFPSFVMMLIFTAFLAKFDNQAQITYVMLGMQVGALAVILVSLQGLAKGFERDIVFWVLVLVSIFFNMQFPSYEPLIIIGFGAALVLSPFRKTVIGLSVVFFLGTVAFADVVESASPETLLNLVWVCFKSGAFVFGSGLAIVPILEQEVVQHYHWLTHTQFLNSLALGQVTPGPVVITATSIGYYVAGYLGAVIATVSIFLASFIHMSTWFPSAVEYLSKQKWIANFSRGAIAAVLGSITFAVFKLGKDLEWNAMVIAVAIFALLVAYTKRLPTWAIIPLCGLILLIKFQFD